MSWLSRLERALAQRLEGELPPDAHPLELAHHLGPLLEQHLVRGKLGVYCPNRVIAPVNSPVLLQTLAQEIADRGWTLPGELHVLAGEPGLAFGRPGGPSALGLLEVFEGLSRGKVGFVPSAGALVGRAEEADLRLGGPGVSRRHLQVEPSSEGFLLRPLSKSPTLVEGAVLSGTLGVRSGAVLEVGGNRVAVLAVAT